MEWKPMSVTVDKVFEDLDDILGQIVEERGFEVKAVAWDVRQGFLKRYGDWRTHRQLASPTPPETNGIIGKSDVMNSPDGLDTLPETTDGR